MINSLLNFSNNYCIYFLFVLSCLLSFPLMFQRKISGSVVKEIAVLLCIISLFRPQYNISLCFCLWNSFHNFSLKEFHDSTICERVDCIIHKVSVHGVLVWSCLDWAALERLAPPTRHILLTKRSFQCAAIFLFDAATGNG